MPRKGRALERVVEVLEKTLGPQGVKVTSPDYIRDRDGGEMREVDVSLRATVGSTKVLVIVEVRDRKEKGDSPWIEQIRTKRESVGASGAMAVSRSGFTRGARAKANAHNIDLRILSELEAADLSGWMQGDELVLQQTRVTPVQVGCSFAASEAERARELLGGSGLDFSAKNLHSYGKALSVSDIVETANRVLKISRQRQPDTSKWPRPEPGQPLSRTWQGYEPYRTTFMRIVAEAIEQDYPGQENRRSAKLDPGPAPYAPAALRNSYSRRYNLREHPSTEALAPRAVRWMIDARCFVRRAATNP